MFNVFIRIPRRKQLDRSFNIHSRIVRHFLTLLSKALEGIARPCHYSRSQHTYLPFYHLICHLNIFHKLLHINMIKDTTNLLDSVHATMIAWTHIKRTKIYRQKQILNGGSLDNLSMTRRRQNILIAMASITIHASTKHIVWIETDNTS